MMSLLKVMCLHDESSEGDESPEGVMLQGLTCSFTVLRGVTRNDLARLSVMGPHEDLWQG